MYEHTFMKTPCAYQPGQRLYLGICRPKENTELVRIYMIRKWWDW